MNRTVSAGRWPEADAMLEDIEDAARDLDASLLPIDFAATVETGRLDREHCDPFDRMIAAQARLGGCALLTVDRSFVDAAVDLAIAIWRTALDRAEEHAAARTGRVAESDPTVRRYSSTVVGHFEW